MKRTVGFVLVCACLFSCLPAVWAQGTAGRSVTADAAAFGEGCFSVLLMEQSTGEILCEHNADARHPIASVTKVMSLLLIAEAIDEGRIGLEDVVTVSENAAGKGGSQIYLEVGETMSVQELLKAVVVASANDGATALAEHLCGTEAVFVAQMTARAEELGLDVEFTNPTGLDDEGCHEASARDVAVISRELLSHGWITEYSTIWMDSVRGGAFSLTNTNRLVRFYHGATGLKTGFTSKAGHCISASAERDGMQLIAVVLGADSSARRFEAAKALLDYGFANFSLYTPVSEQIGELAVLGGTQSCVRLCTSREGLLLERGLCAKVEEQIELPERLSAPVREGDKVGEAVFLADGKELCRRPILAAQSVEEAGFFFLLSRLLRAMLFGA